MERDPGADPRAGAGADRGRELRPRDPAAPGLMAMAVRRTTSSALAAELRAHGSSSAAGRWRSRASRAPGALDAIRDRLVDERGGAALEPSAASSSRERVLRDTVGLGPLEELLDDPEVEEVLVNGHERGLGRAARAGSSGPTSASPTSRQLRDVIERILGPIGRRVDELSPMADGRLAGRLAGQRDHPAARGRRADASRSGASPGCRPDARRAGPARHLRRRAARRCCARRSARVGTS